MRRRSKTGTSRELGLDSGQGQVDTVGEVFDENGEDVDVAP